MVITYLMLQVPVNHVPSQMFFTDGKRGSRTRNACQVVLFSQQKGLGEPLKLSHIEKGKVRRLPGFPKKSFHETKGENHIRTKVFLHQYCNGKSTSEHF